AAPTSPVGSDPGDTTTAGATVSVYARLPLSFAPFVAVTVNGNIPAAVGVPVSAPLLLRLSPSRFPEATAKVNGPAGPDAVIAWLYGEPTSPLGRVAGDTTTGTWTSNAPMSAVPFETRTKPGPRWSVVSPPAAALLPWSIAGLPAFGAIVG